MIGVWAGVVPLRAGVCIEIAYRIVGGWQRVRMSVGALQKMHVLIRVPQKPASQLILVGPYP